MSQSSRFVPGLLALALLGSVPGARAAARAAVPGRALATGPSVAPVASPAQRTDPILEPRDPLPSPRPFAPRPGWGGYLGNVEGSVRAAIERARGEARTSSAHGVPLPDEPAKRTTPGPGSDGNVTRRLWLGPVVPNPSASRAALHFDLPAAARVRIAVVDVAGRMVRDTDRTMEAGRHSFALDLPGGRMAPGVYFVIMDVNGRRVGTRRLVLRY